MAGKVDLTYINQKLSQADLLGGNQDGKIEKDEKKAIEIFKSLVDSDYNNGKKARINKATYEEAMRQADEIMGLAVEKTAEAPSEASASNVKLKRSEKKDFNNFVEDLAKANRTPSEILEAAKKDYSTEKYNDKVERLEKWVNAVNAEPLNNEKDVKNLKDKLEKDYNNGKRLSGEDKKIADMLTDAAKEVVVRKELDEINETYKSVLKKHEGEFRTNDQLRNEVAEELSKKGKIKTSVSVYGGVDVDKYGKPVKYTEEDLKSPDRNGKRPVVVKSGESYYKEAFERFDRKLEKDAQSEVAEFYKASGSETEKGVRKDVNEGIQNDRISKAANKNLQEHDAEGITARKNTFENRAKELKDYELKSARKELGKDIYEKLTKKYIDERKGNKADFSELSNIIRDRMGSDYEVNISSNSKIAEQEQIREDLRKLTGQDFTEGQVLEIIDFCRAETLTEKNKLFGNGKDLGEDIAIGAVAGGIGPWEAIQDVTVTVSQDFADQIKRELGKEATLKTLADGNVAVNIHQEVLFGPLMVAGGVLSALALHILFQALVGEDKGYETACNSLVEEFDASKPEFRTEEAYKEHIKQRYPDKADALIALLEVYGKPEGKYDPMTWITNLNKIGGSGSPKNCKEMFGAVMFNKKPEVVEPQKTEEETPPVVEETTPDDQDTIIIDRKVSQNFNWSSSSYSWAAVIETFYPGAIEKYGYMKMVNAFREAQGISKKSNIPVKQDLTMKDLVIDGEVVPVKSYDSQKEADDAVKKNNTADTFGWTSKYYLQNWNVKVTEVSKVKSEKTEEYSGSRLSDGKTTSGKSTVKEVLDDLIPEAKDDRDIKLDIKVEFDHTQDDDTQVVRKNKKD